MQRKHRSQMTTEEIKYAETLVHSITEWNFAVDHIMDRMAEKNIKKQDAVNTLRYQQALDEFRNDLTNRARGRREVDITAADRQRILNRAEQLRRTNENH